MKSLIVIGIVIAAVLLAGCTAAVPASSTATTGSTPDLTGTWTGSMAAYLNGTGYSASPEGSMIMTVDNQTGRIFSGTMSFARDNGTRQVIAFAGAIGRDNKTITITNGGGGYDTGSVISDNELELVYVSDHEPFTISIDSLRRG